MSRTLTVYLAADLKKFSGPLRMAQNDMGTFGRNIDGLSNNLTRMLGPALIGAAAAAGVAAVAFGVDGVKAFVEDEAAAAKLATTMQNLGMEDATASVEANIDALQRQTGVADSELRPAMSRLLTSTKDVALATDMMKLAMDVSQGTGRSLEGVVNSLARGFDGSTTSLGKLGAGLDKATLATGDMRLITEELSRTVSGQAETAANTYQGQLDRLAVGFDELKESFGAGFLQSLDDTTQGTNDLMDAMSELEPAMRNLGTTASKAAVGLAKFAAESANVVDGAVAMAEEPSWDGLITHIRNTYEATDQFKGAIGGIPGVGRFLEDMYDVIGAWLTLNDAQGNGFVDIGGGELPPVDKSADAWLMFYENKRDAITADRHASEQAAAEARKQRMEEQRLLAGSRSSVEDLSKSYEFNTEKLQSLTLQLVDASGKLETAKLKVEEYAAALSSDLLKGVNIGEAIDTGKKVGISTLEAFNKQIDQANWYGNVLREIKAQGGNEQLLNMLREAGPEQGGAWGQALIDDGLVPTINGKLEDVTKAANETAMAMVPEWGPAGIESATLYVNSTIEQLQAEHDRLKKIGKAIGKPIGANIKAEILTAVAEALESAEKTKTAAQATKAATQANAAAAASPQVMAITLAQMLTNANNRGGYSMGVPIPSPVLG